MAKTRYELLNITKEKFTSLLFRELVFVTDYDHAQKIATFISDDVAQDVCDCADLENWSVSDIRIGIGRVLLKHFGIQE